MLEQHPQLFEQVVEQVLGATGAKSVVAVEQVQSLWSGYGQIVRLHLQYSETKSGVHVPLDAPLEVSPAMSSAVPSSRTSSRPSASSTTGSTTSSTTSPTIIVKLIQPPEESAHPRGWNTDASTQRKLLSYDVETQWYVQHAANTQAICALPKLLHHHVDGQTRWLILEDLDTHYPVRHSYLSVDQCHTCLQWLARFHALHIGSEGHGLWPTGTYWHLTTRADEYAAMPEGELKKAAQRLDALLENCHFKTLVHGDAKVANICFSEDSSRVAMVDFQYVGKGCGMRDVAYFLGSCLDETECSRYADLLLDVYFEELGKHVCADIQQALEAEWRDLYAIAWADFHRFLAGWMPEHKKIHRYTRAMTQRALSQL